MTPKGDNLKLRSFAGKSSCARRTPEVIWIGDVITRGVTMLPAHPCAALVCPLPFPRTIPEALCQASGLISAALLHAPVIILQLANLVEPSQALGALRRQLR